MTPDQIGAINALACAAVETVKQSHRGIHAATLHALLGCSSAQFDALMATMVDDIYLTTGGVL